MNTSLGSEEIERLLGVSYTISLQENRVCFVAMIKADHAKKRPHLSKRETGSLYPPHNPVWGNGLSAHFEAMNSSIQR